MDNIELHTTDDVKTFFASGKIVLKIVATNIHNNKTRDVGMVTTKEDYEKKLKTHRYSSLLYQVSFYHRLAYLYNCLNHDFMKSRYEKYDFYWRTLGDNEWHHWFTINPYQDRMY